VLNIKGKISLPTGPGLSTSFPGICQPSFEIDVWVPAREIDNNDFRAGDFRFHVLDNWFGDKAFVGSFALNIVFLDTFFNHAIKYDDLIQGDRCL
jgi:hypothetical protein